MPTVPSLLTPDRAPTESGTPALSVPVSADAFGGAIGTALSGLGTSIEGASDKIWARAVELQNLNNDTEAKRADTAYMIKAGNLHADFSALEGDAARAAFPKYMQDQQQAREDIRGTLSNPMAQKMYDSSSLNFMGRNIFNAAGHAAQQTKVSANNASTARVQTLTDNIGENPDDEQGFQRGIRSIQAETRSQGVNGGWSEDQIKATTDANVSTAVSKRIVGLARTDPFGAQRMYDQASDGKNLLPNDAARVQATIQTQSRQVISRNVSGMVNADLDHPSDPDTAPKSLEDRIAEAKANPDVAKFSKNDPLLPDFVEQRVIADYNRSKAITRDADQRAEQTVQGALLQGNKEGILPKSVDELKLVSPDASTAWDSLKPTTQRKYMAQMAQNAKGETVAWTDDGLRNYQSIKGQAVADPVEFLNRDIVAEKNLPNSAKRELINLQSRLTQQSTSDPRVGRALQLLGPDLQAAGITKTGDKEGYYQFVGAMQDALDDFHQNNKKTPSYDDIKKIGSRLMQEQVTSKGWLWDSKSPLYSTPVPEEDEKRIRESPFWQQKGITTVRPDQVQRYYAAEQYNKLYGGSAKSGTTQ